MVDIFWYFKILSGLPNLCFWLILNEAAHILLMALVVRAIDFVGFYFSV